MAPTGRFLIRALEGGSEARKNREVKEEKGEVGGARGGRELESRGGSLLQLLCYWLSGRA